MMGRRRKNTATPIGIDTYRDDALYPRIVQAVEALLAGGKVVAPVDVLVHMDLLQPKQLEDWRRGRVPQGKRIYAVRTLSR